MWLYLQLYSPGTELNLQRAFLVLGAYFFKGKQCNIWHLKLSEIKIFTLILYNVFYFNVHDFKTKAMF